MRSVLMMSGAERQRRYRAKHPERLVAQRKAHYAANQEKEKARHARWVIANMEYLREYERNRYLADPKPKRASSARRRSLAGSFDGLDLMRLYELQYGQCAYCRTRLRGKYEIDHIIPVALGGSSLPQNIQLLCRKCNRRKGKRDPIAHARSLGKLI